MAGKNYLLPAPKPVQLYNEHFVMQQSELGRRLTALRKEKNLTQEELVEKSHVSVRTIQRIESGEVLPRLSTLKILLAALGENAESFLTKPNETMEPQKDLAPHSSRNTLFTAALAGIVYLVCEIILGTLDIAWIVSDHNWGLKMNAVYTGLTVIMVISFALFARGFIALSILFENSLLKAVSYVLILARVGMAIMDVTSLSVHDPELLTLPYAMISVAFGALSIAFGIALIRLQDGMGELSRIAGLLEIAIGCLLITVILFFITYVVLIPAIVVEILVLYRGYEYLSRPALTTQTQA